MNSISICSALLLDKKTVQILEQYLQTTVQIVDYYVIVYTVDSYHYTSKYFSDDLSGVLDCLSKNVGTVLETTDTVYKGIGWELHMRYKSYSRDTVLNELLCLCEDKSDYILHTDIRDHVVVIPDMWKYSTYSMRSAAYNIKCYTLSNDMLLGDYTWCPYLLKNDSSWRYSDGTLRCTSQDSTTDYVLETSIHIVRNRWTIDSIDLNSIENNPYRLGLLHRLMGRYEDAIDAYKERVMQDDMILDYSDEICTSYYSMAVCSILLDDYISYEYYLRMAAYLYGHIKIGPWCSLVTYYINKGRLFDAYNISKDSISLVTDSRLLYLMSIHINVCYKLGYYDECRDLCIQIEQIVQQYSDIDVVSSALNAVQTMRELCSNLY